MGRRSTSSIKEQRSRGLRVKNSLKTMSSVGWSRAMPPRRRERPESCVPRRVRALTLLLGRMVIFVRGAVAQNPGSVADGMLAHGPPSNRPGNDCRALVVASGCSSLSSTASGIPSGPQVGPVKWTALDSTKAVRAAATLGSCLPDDRANRILQRMYVHRENDSFEARLWRSAIDCLAAKTN